MRMGKAEKQRRGEKTVKADAKGKPKFASRGSTVGKLSPDIISTYFLPELTSLAKESLEQYADDLMNYEDALRVPEEVLVSPDSAISSGQNGNKEPSAPLYRSQYRVNELEFLLKETSNHFQSKNGGWKVHAKAARFERLMDEKYGIFRPFLKEHPEVEQFVRGIQRKYATGQFSPFRQGKAPIPKSTAVIILFMMQRGNLRWEVTVLAILFFLVGLQPWALVVLIAGGHAFTEKRKKRTLKPMKSFIPASEPYYTPPDRDAKDIPEGSDLKVDILKKPVGSRLGAAEEINGQDFDTMVLGSGPAALYSAALLARAGRKVVVLSTKLDASGCYEMNLSEQSIMEKFQSVAFDVESSNVARLSKQQELLAPALSTSTDYQGGIRFSQIGDAASGNVFEILSVPGMGTEAGESDVPFLLRADGSALIEDASLCLGDGFQGLSGKIEDSAAESYISACETINASSQQYLMSKLLPEKTKSLRGTGTYEVSSVRSASNFLEKGFPLNPHVRSLMAAIGMRGENLKPSRTSMGAHVSNICAATSGEGMFYPIGGPRALCHALAAVVQQSGGKILTDVPVAELLFDEYAMESSSQANTETGTLQAPRCIGVQLVDGRRISFDMKKWSEKDYFPAIVSTHGFVTTFIRLLPEKIRTTYKVPRGLPALSERRPVFKVLFALEGSCEDLDLTGADFYRLPSCAVPQDEIHPTTGEVKFGKIGGPDILDNDSKLESGETMSSPISEDGEVIKNDSKTPVLKPKTAQVQRLKFETGVSWLQISFPSAKDPSFKSRHGDVSTCVVTIEADDDFVTPFETKPKLYAIQKGKDKSSGEHQRLMERVKRDLLDLYPQLEGKILQSELVGPLHRGLSHNPERYAAKGIRPESPYPGLYLGGADLTIGESFSGSIVGGWMVANAVMGYSEMDHTFLGKNITSDISEYLEEPDIPDLEDIAVPFSTPSHPNDKVVE